MRWLIGILLLSLLALTSCATKTIYLRGDSKAIPLKDGIPQGWSGAWMISDEALSDLLGKLEACKEMKK